MFSSRRYMLQLAAALILAVVTYPAIAAEGRIPIPFTSPPATPINITSPGKYILTRPLKATAAGPVINIAVGVGVGASEVDIDLNGFTLDASASGAACIRGSSLPGSTAEISIRNGAIQGGVNGIQLVGAPGAPLRKVVIEGVRIGGTTSNAVQISDAQNFLLRDIILIDAGVGAAGPAAGILVGVGGGGLALQGSIENNLIRNTKDGISVLGAAATPVTVALLNNRLESIAAGGTTGDAIHLENDLGCLVSENTIREVLGGNGIRLVNTSGTKLFDNVVNRASASGIFVDAASGDNLVWRNVVQQAASSGLYVAGKRNQIDANLLNLNGRGLTLDLAAGAVQNVYRENTARGNTGAAPCPGGLCSADFCGFAVGANSTQADNWLPAVAGAPPACEK